MENLKLCGIFEQKKGKSSYGKPLIILQVKKLKFKESKYMFQVTHQVKAAEELDILSPVTQPNINFNVLGCLNDRSEVLLGSRKM